MKRFKIIQIYVVPAGTKREAMDKWVAAESSTYFETTVVKEVEERGFFGALKKQIAG